ncbi:hypothetical protein ACFYRY_30715 [Streptomyces sp. NPDC005263]|uniref:hypothetical protein n=1 Tax=Streptomyces sp. NPDC005263 TaxID=3364711 RepID=UPI0036A981FD
MSADRGDSTSRDGRAGQGESAKEAATRAWLMLPLATRRKLAEKPGSTSPCERVTKRLWQSLLRLTVLEVREDLAPVVTSAGSGLLTPDQADAVAEAVLSQAERLDTAGDWHQGLRAAHQRLRTGKDADSQFAPLGERTYRLAWEASARHGRQVTEAVCEALMATVLHGDPDTPPPTPAALRALCLDPAAVAQLQAIIDETWAPATDPPVTPVTPAPASSPSPSPQSLVQALLDEPYRSTESGKLWDAYAKSRPWRTYLAHADELGLSRHAEPPKPRPVEAGWRSKKDTSTSTGESNPTGESTATGDSAATGRSTSTGDERRREAVLPSVPPLDRSLRERLHSPLGQLQKHPHVAHRTTRQIAHEEAVRSCQPLGIQDDVLRAILCLGPVFAGALVPETAYEWKGGGPNGTVPRRLRQLSRQALRQPYVRETLRLGAAQHPSVRAALEDPDREFGAALWGVLHKQELIGTAVEPEDLWNTLIMSASWKFLMRQASVVKAVLDPSRPSPDPVIDGDADMDLVADPAPSVEDAATAVANEPWATVAEALARGLEQQGLRGQSAHLYLDRLTDPRHHAWAADTWQSLYDGYRDQYGTAPAMPAVSLDQARQFVVRFRTLHSPGGAR